MLVARGELYLGAGRLEEGLAELRAAFGIAETIGYARQTWDHGAALGRALAAAGREPAARAAYRAAVDAVNRTLPRVPDAGLREALLAAEPVARLREEARALGATEAAGPSSRS